MLAADHDRVMEVVVLDEDVVGSVDVDQVASTAGDLVVLDRDATRPSGIRGVLLEGHVSALEE